MLDLFKYNYKNFKIFSTFLLLWFSVFFEDIVEDFVAFGLIFTVGILHGANDIFILSKNDKLFNKTVKHLIIYLFIIAVSVVFFFIDSKIALALFVLFSAYHFGEEHYEDKIDISFPFNTIYYFTYGLVLFSILLYMNIEFVNSIVYELTESYFIDEYIEYVLIVTSGLYVLLTFYLWYQKHFNLLEIIEEVFYLLLFTLIFEATSLILGFAIYFIFWHSIPSIIGQIKYLAGDVNKKSIISYLKKAFIFWLISVIFLVALYVWIPDIEYLENAIFLILFAVTAPHIWVMFKMRVSE